MNLKLLAKLNSDFENIRLKGIAELEKKGKSAVEQLFLFIREENDLSIKALKKVIDICIDGNKMSKVPKLKQEAADHDENIAHALKALAKIGTPAVEALLEALKEEDCRYKGMIMQTLALIKDQRAIKPLLALVDDQKWQNDATEALETITGDTIENIRNPGQV